MVVESKVSHELFGGLKEQEVPSGKWVDLSFSQTLGVSQMDGGYDALAGGKSDNCPTIFLDGENEGRGLINATM